MFRRLFSSSACRAMCRGCDYDFTTSFMIGAGTVAYITIMTITTHNITTQSNIILKNELKLLREELEKNKML